MHHVVLFATYSGVMGGAERLLLDFASALEHESALVCPEGELAVAARGSGLRVFAIRPRSLAFRATLADRVLAGFRLAGFTAELSRLVRDLDPALVVLWGMRAALASTAPQLRRRPFVFHHNDLLTTRVLASAVRACASRAALVTVPSHAVARDLDPSGALDRRLVVVHPGVDLERYGLGAEPVQPPEVLVLGALVAWKRPDLALDAFALVRARHPQARLRFVGGALTPGDPLPGELRRRAKRAGLDRSVEFAGVVEDARPELARATCLLHCAPREPFGLAVLEALAAARPAVVPRAGGPAEIVDENCAVLYPPGDAVAAANALVWLLDDRERARRMGQLGRARAAEHFDAGSARRRFAGALKPLVTARSAERVAGAGSDALTLVTVTHNSAPELGALLASVQRHLPETPVVVVDCASTDETLEVAREWSSVVTVALSENVGFGRACNRGLDEVGSPVTVLVNPDVELVDDSLLALAAQAAQSDKPPRLLAPVVLNPDGSRQDSVHPAPASVPALLHALLPPALVRPRLAVSTAPFKATKPRRVGWAIGAALCARTSILRSLGPFSERIFLFGEDLELGLRAATEGIETWFWPHARVVHRGGHSTDPAFGGEPFELLARQRHCAIASTLGPRHARLDDAEQALTFASRSALKRAAGRDNARERRQLEALRRTRAA